MVYSKTDIEFLLTNFLLFLLLEFFFLELSSSSHFHKSNTGMQL